MHAVIPNFGCLYDKGVWAEHAVDVGGEDGAFVRFVKALHLSGVTLATRGDNMVLTRPLRMLVRGSGVGHVATVCDVESQVVMTAAFKLVESTAMTALLSEVSKLVVECNHFKCLLTELVAGVSGYGALERRETAKMSRLRETPTMKNLLGTFPYVLVEPCVLMIQAAAIMIASYEDAGTKFRDRASRHECARHFGQAVVSVLMSPQVR